MFRICILSVVGLLPFAAPLRTEQPLARRFPPPEFITVEEVGDETFKNVNYQPITEIRTRLMDVGGDKIEEKYTAVSFAAVQMVARTNDFRLVNLAGKKVDWPKAKGRAVLLSSTVRLCTKTRFDHKMLCCRHCCLPNML